MAGTHEFIKWELIKIFSKTGRGRLYCCNQAMAIPINGEAPLWFGPLKRTDKGYPDTYGYEWLFVEQAKKKFPVYAVAEIKTLAYSKLSKEQIMKLDYFVYIGAYAYVCRELKQGGFSLYRWLGDGKEGKEDTLQDYSLKRWGE